MGIITLTTSPLQQPSSNSDSGSDNHTNYEESTPGYESKVPIALSCIYLGYCVVFILMSYLIAIKMGNIFQKIIQNDSWVRVTTDKSSRAVAANARSANASSTRSIDNTIDQKGYFWFGNPDLIITFAQLMQFGYSVGLAILLVFSKTVKAGNVFVWWGWFFVTPIICFLLFVWLWSDIIMAYTQCTSLGELVHKKHLIDIDARSKLDEERHRRRSEIDHILAEKEVAENMENRTKKRMKTKRVKTRSSISLESMQVDESLMQISEFVKKRTKDLPRARIKSNSSGVVIMKFYGEGNTLEENALPEVEKGNTAKAGRSSIKRSIYNNNLQDDDSLTTKTSLEVALRRLFLSKEYRQVSAVFGTMVAIYLIAFRLQTILVKTCRMMDKENVWDFTLDFSSAFWILFVWFWIFIAESALVVVLFLRESGREHFFMVFAGIFDILLSSICLVLLIMAESNRCCDCNTDDDVPSYSYLLMFQNMAEGSSTSETINDNPFYCSTDNLCCPKFGSRLCGGIGVIEPVSSIIVLRLLRFIASRQFCKRFKIKMLKKSNVEVNTNEIKRRDQFKDISNKSGTMAELWILALTEHSAIAKKHGIFSGFLLEAMLGVSPLPEGQTSTQNLLGPGIRSGIIFERPYSQLVRSMRRCYSKYPLLDDEWHLVDVALTEHELIWFDVKVEDTKLSAPEMEEMQSIQEVMKTTNGGENMRLCDISMGRTVLGRFSLSDLQYAIVQRSSMRQLLNDTDSSKENLTESETNQIKHSLLACEYWFSVSSDNEGTLSSLRKNGFDHSRIHDTLKLHSNHGTLFLKFIADMRCNVDEKFDPRKENESTSWCEDIERLRGSPIASDQVEIIDEDQGVKENEGQKKSFIEHILHRTK